MERWSPSTQLSTLQCNSLRIQKSYDQARMGHIEGFLMGYCYKSCPQRSAVTHFNDFSRRQVHILRFTVSANRLNRATMLYNRGSFRKTTHRFAFEKTCAEHEGYKAPSSCFYRRRMNFFPCATIQFISRGTKPHVQDRLRNRIQIHCLVWQFCFCP